MYPHPFYVLVFNVKMIVRKLDQLTIHHNKILEDLTVGEHDIHDLIAHP
ncbi:MAG: hypothetical protein IH941_07090 [Acidobacteria bacterium]|nr:hypothetical protein [Acidobacteriota bacterium]